MVPRNVNIAIALLGASAIAACAGGSASAPAPQPSATLGGLGTTSPLDQTTNFTVIVPPLTTIVAVGAIARKHIKPLSVTNPYVSPQTASVVLQLGSVNGVSLVHAPAPNPPVNIPATCIGSANGCSVLSQGVKAAKGVNRFQVATFSGTNGTGNVISIGYVDVVVPSTQSTAFGGTALSIGGFTAQLSLVLNPPAGFKNLVPGTATVDVNAIDPGGAVIIGNSTLANPIALQLGGADIADFTLAGGTQVTLTASMQSIPIAYNGKTSPGGEVDASTIDENGAAVSTALPIPAGTPPPSPTPTPLPGTTPTPVPPGATPTPSRTPLSIYVYDASSDNIVEYDGVRNIEAGYRPNPTQTPRRAFAFAVDPNAYPNCAAIVGAQNSSPDLGGIAVLPNGTIYAQSKCTDPAVTQAYTFSYPAATQQLATPPPAAVAFAASLTTPGTAAQPLGIKYDAAHGKLFVGYPDLQNAGPNLLGYGVGSSAVSDNVAAACLSELGQATNCSSYGPMYSGGQGSFALDGAGFAYAPVTYNDLPPGTAGQQIQSESAIATINLNNSNPAPYPLSALAGVPDDLGTIGVSSFPVAVEGTTFYALGAPGEVFDFNNQNTPATWAGLSNCTAPPDPLAPVSATTACADANPHTYLIGFAGATTALTSTAAGQDLVAAPTFELGGDGANGGNFGTSTFGDILTVVNGFAYVANAMPSINSPSQSPPYAAEIDVYDVRTISGAHADGSASPVARILLPTSVYPTAITIGPTGPVTGGLQILARGARPLHNVGAWILERRMRLQQHMQARRHRHH